MFGLAVAATSARADEPAAWSSYAECASTKVSAANANAAHGAFVAGKASFDAGDYPTALTYLKDAYRRDCRKIELLLLIARSYELLGANGAAVLTPGVPGARRSDPKRDAARALEAYLQRATDATDAGTQRERLARLKEEIARLDAEDADAAAKRAAAAQVQTATPAAPVPPMTSASSTEAPAEARSHTALPWVVAGVGVAGVAAGAALFAVGHGRESDASNACPTMTACSPDVASKGNSGAHEKNAGIGLLAGGAAALVGGLVWHLVEPTGPRDGAVTTSAFDVQPLFAPASPFASAASPSLAGVAFGAHGIF